MRPEGATINQLISCPLRSRPRTSLDLVLFHASHSSVLVDAYLHLQVSKHHQIRCHSCFHVSWQLLPCKHNWHCEVFLPFLFFQSYNLKPLGGLKSPPSYATTKLSEFSCNHFGKLTTLMSPPRSLTEEWQGHLVYNMLQSPLIFSQYQGLKNTLFQGKESHFCIHSVAAFFSLEPLANYQIMKLLVKSLRGSNETQKQSHVKLLCW